MKSRGGFHRGIKVWVKKSSCKPCRIGHEMRIAYPMKILGRNWLKCQKIIGYKKSCFGRMQWFVLWYKLNTTRIDCLGYIGVKISLLLFSLPGINEPHAQTRSKIPLQVSSCGATQEQLFCGPRCFWSVLVAFVYTLRRHLTFTDLPGFLLFSTLEKMAIRTQATVD